MNKLTKLDSFVREVFRMHSIVVQVINRECMKDTRIGAYDIVKGNNDLLIVTERLLVPTLFDRMNQ
jgi:cytochrome P450